MAMTPTDGQFGVVGMTAGSDELAGDVYVNFLYWVSKGASAGDDLSITDSDDNVLWVDSADAANYSAVYPLKMKCNGVKVGTIDSGTLYVVKASADREHNY